MSAAGKFEAIEHPIPGWTLRKIKRWEPIGAPVEWVVQLTRDVDGIQVEFRHASLHVAFLRCSEAAHMKEQGI